MNERFAITAFVNKKFAIASFICKKFAITKFVNKKSIIGVFMNTFVVAAFTNNKIFYVSVGLPGCNALQI